MDTLIILVGFLCSISSIVAMETVYMQDECNNDRPKYISSSSQLRVKANKWSDYESHSDCKFTVTSLDITYKLMIQFKDLSIEYSDDCDKDWLTLYDTDSVYSFSNTIGKDKFCGYATPDRIYTTSGDSVTFKFHSDSYSESSGFEIIITPFTTGYCYSWQIDCNNRRCVDDSLRCNGYNPCGDHSDCKLTAAAIAGICVGSVGFVVIIITVTVFCCIRRRRMAPRRIPATHATVATFATTGVQMTQQPPPYTVYNPQVGYIVQQPTVYATGVASPQQPMTSYPPQANEAPK